MILLKKKYYLPIIFSLLLLSLTIIFSDMHHELLVLLRVLSGGFAFYTLLLYLFESRKLAAEWGRGRIASYVLVIILLIIGMQLSNWVNDDHDSFWVVNGNIWVTDILASILLMLIFFIAFSWLFGHWTRIQNLKNEKVIAELALLKTQINPHFFFNTLNNLYSLIKKDPDKAQEYVLKLSDMMRFTIYEGKGESVTVENEIQYIRNFIDLQTGRYHSVVDVNLDAQITNPSRKIPPLLFIILVENAFKHGVERLISGAFINIKIVEDDDKVVFQVENNFDESEASQSEGIGLQNLKERLELLFPNQYQFHTHSEDNIYTARLELT